jgi:hypothetical protein
LDKKGIGKISIMFYSLIFIILWALFFGEQVAYWGHLVVVNGGLSGIEAFLYNNVNLILAVVFFIFILAVGTTGGSE